MARGECERWLNDGQCSIALSRLTRDRARRNDADETAVVADCCKRAAARGQVARVCGGDFRAELWIERGGCAENNG